MEKPNIILSIFQGPKKGQTLDCSPGSAIFIGRVLRGNTFTIKDPKISEKHIAVEFHREICRWAVRDLNTSNGTTVNDAVISPNIPFPLTDGDNIKIGARTSMSVTIYAPTLAPEFRMEKFVEKMEESKKHGGNVGFQGKICSLSDNVDGAMKIVCRKRHGPRMGAAAAANSLMEKFVEKKVEEPEKNRGNVDFQGKICSLPDNVDDAMKIVPRTRHGRRIGAAAAATSLMEKFVEKKVEEPEKHEGIQGMIFSVSDSIDDAMKLMPRTRHGPRIGAAAAAATSSMTKFVEKKVEEPEKHEGNVDFQGKICSLSDIVDDAMKIVPRTRHGRRIGAAASATSLMDKFVKKEVEEPEKHEGVQGKIFSVSDNVDDAMKLMPQTRHGRRRGAAPATSPREKFVEEKVEETEKHEGIDDFQGKICSLSDNINDAVKLMPTENKRGRLRRGSTDACSDNGAVEQAVVDVKKNVDGLNKNGHKGRARQKKDIVSAGASKNNKALEPVEEEGGFRNAENFSETLKENEVEREVEQKKVGRLSKNAGKGRSRHKSGPEPIRILQKDAELGPMALEHKIGRFVKALPIASSSRVMIVQEEDRDALEKIEELVKDGEEGRAGAKRGGRTAKVSWKDEVLDPVALPPRRGRVTRASTMTSNYIALIGEEHKGEDAKIKVEKANETFKNRGKRREKSKRGGRSTRVSKKGEVLESGIEENTTGNSTGALDVPVASSSIQKNIVSAEVDLDSSNLPGQRKGKSIVENDNGVQKMLPVNREVSFVFEEAENHKDTTMSGDSNKSEILDLPNKIELVYSWSSFSEIRGIPNTTSKYREDRLINCHATPFEDRIERALNRVTAETSSSVEI